MIADNTVIERRAHIDRSIIWRNTYVGQHSEVRGALIGAECNIQPNAVVFENAVVSDHTVLGRGSIIQPNVKIWPNKEVEAGAVVATSIIWGSSGRRVLFGRYGVSGLINVDFTPEMVTRLGSAYASTLPIGANVTVNRDLVDPVSHAEAGSRLGITLRRRECGGPIGRADSRGALLHLRPRTRPVACTCASRRTILPSFIFTSSIAAAWIWTKERSGRSRPRTSVRTCVARISATSAIRRTLPTWRSATPPPFYKPSILT